jgi:DNA-binding NarL/FixJ family response regulator
MNAQATSIVGGTMAAAGDTGVVSEQEWLALRENLSLSRQQAEIIRHILCGASDKEIAESMEISVSTVRTYLHRLFRKFQLNDRLKLALHVVACARRQPQDNLGDDAEPSHSR